MTFNSTYKLMKNRIETMKDITEEFSMRAGVLLAATDKDPSLLKDLGGYLPILRGIQDKSRKHEYGHVGFIRSLERIIKSRQMSEPA